MTEELLYQIVTQLFYSIYSACLAFVYYYLIKELFSKRYLPILVALSYFIALTVLKCIPLELTNFIAYSTASFVGLFAMLIIERGNVAKKIAITLLFFAVRWSVTQIVSALQEVYYSAAFPHWSGVLFLVIMWSVEYILLFSILFIIVRYLKRTVNPLIIRWNEALLLSTPALIAVMSYAILDMFWDVVIIGLQMELLLALYCGILLVVILLFLKLYAALEQKKSAHYEQLLLNNQVMQTKQHIQQVQVLYDDFKELKHDLGNHLNVIDALVEKELYEEAKQFSKKVREKSNEQLLFQTGNAVLNVVLEEQAKRAASKGITLHANFIAPVKLAIDTFDLSVILQNLLKNAMEASETMDDVTIELYSKQQRDVYSITLKNPFVGSVSWDNEKELPSSSKREEGHGIGLQTVKKLTKYYNGDLMISTKEQQFTISILLMG